MEKLFVAFLCWFYKQYYRKKLQWVSDLLHAGGDKKKLLAMMKELHLSNDGSFKSSTAVIVIPIMDGYFRIAHKHGYVTVSFKVEDNLNWLVHLFEPFDWLPDELVDFEDSVLRKHFPDKFKKKRDRRNRYYDDFY